MGPKWKREVIQDHKFDFIDVKSFTAHGKLLWAGYLWVFVDILKSVAVYVLDTQTAIFLLAFNKWATQVKPAIDLSISRWIFSGCIIFSFLLLAKDWWTARKIIRSKDISFAYTNLIANRWYSVRGGYAYFCLFDKLEDSRHAWDSVAFFVFFSFKGWKRLILAEGPRQVLNAITLYSVAKDQDFSFDVHRYQRVFSTIQGVVMSFMLLTVAIWTLSFIRLLVAAVLYWPLLCCHIRGNLKEYCCHKIDKRISQILADRRRRRYDPKPEKKKDTGDSTSLESGLKSQPTLPKVELDGDGASVFSMPLYPLSRSDSQELRRGLLRMDTASTMGSQPPLYRTDTNTSNPRSLARTDTNISSRTNVTNNPTIPRQPTLPHLVGDFSIPEVPRPPTARPQTPEITRPPTAARVSPESARPATAAPPRIDTRAPARAGGPPSSGPQSARGYGPPPRSNTAESMRGYGPPSRSATDTSMATAREFNAPPRSNTIQSSTGYGPPPRSNTAQTTRTNYGPPPRSNTQQSMNSSAYGPRRPERPFSPNGGYQGGYQAR